MCRIVPGSAELPQAEPAAGDRQLVFEDPGPAGGLGRNLARGSFWLEALEKLERITARGTSSRSFQLGIGSVESFRSRGWGSHGAAQKKRPEIAARSLVGWSARRSSFYLGSYYRAEVLVAQPSGSEAGRMRILESGPNIVALKGG